MLTWLINLIAIKFAEYYSKISVTKIVHLSRCDDCIAGHCDECQANLCTDCTDYDKEEDEDENKMQVEKVLFLICGHTSCNAFIAVGDVWDCCRPCTTLNGIREEQQRLTIQSQLEKDDAIVLKTVLSEFKLELLKRSLSAWFVSCTISQDITTAAPTNKRLKIDE